MSSSFVMRSLFMAIMAGALALFAVAPFGHAQTAQSPAGPKLKASFNHLKTGFPLTGAHVTVTCEACHVDGIFKGTPKDCAGCHSIGVRASATPKPADHVQTSAPC